jgi:hypothetical protein
LCPPGFPITSLLGPFHTSGASPRPALALGLALPAHSG